MNISQFLYFTAALSLVAGTVAGALPQKINLRERDKIAAGLSEKEKSADRPLQRAVAGYDRRRLEMLVCEEKDFPAAEKALEEFINDPGLECVDYVSFLLDTVASDYPLRRGELIRMADKRATASTNKADRVGFYSAVMRKYLVPEYRSWVVKEDPELSNDAFFSYVERAEKDPMVEDKEMVASWKADALVKLCRNDEAEAILRGLVEKADEKKKPIYVEKLANFYLASAERFYSDPDPALRRKAVEMFEYKNSLSKNGDRKAIAALIPVLLSLGDWQKAKCWIDADVALQKDQKPSQSDILWYGDVAYGEKKWREASSWYSQYTAGNADWQVLHKMARAHYADGNFELAHASLTNALKKCRNRYERPHLQFEIDRVEKLMPVGSGITIGK